MLMPDLIIIEIFSTKMYEREIITHLHNDKRFKCITVVVYTDQLGRYQMSTEQFSQWWGGECFIRPEELEKLIQRIHEITKDQNNW